MLLEKPRRIQRPIPLVPLVDVVFLLLMFFMLSTTFLRFSQIDINSPLATAAAKPGERVVPGAILDVSRGPLVKLNGERVEIETLVGRLDELYDRGVRGGIVKPSSDAQVQDLVDVMELVRISKIRTYSVHR